MPVMGQEVPPLSSGISAAEHARKSLLQERIQRLQALDFVWEMGRGKCSHPNQQFFHGEKGDMAMLKFAATSPSASNATTHHSSPRQEPPPDEKQVKKICQNVTTTTLVYGKSHSSRQEEPSSLPVNEDDNEIIKELDI
jgi:hypothetical protein